MFRRECSLCGGKLNGNICTECGLDNSKSDAQYKTLGEHGKYDDLTHVHENANPFAGKTLTKEQKKEMKAAIERKNTLMQPKKENYSGGYSMNQTRGKKKNKKGLGAKVAIIFAVLSMLFGALETIYTMITDGMFEGYEEVYFEATPEDYDPYEYAMYELPETGVSYEMVLEAGSYKGGVHIPEGSYYVEVISGMGYIELEDHFNGIYASYSLSAEETGYEEDLAYIEDLRIYAGTRIDIEEDVVIAIHTEDAVLPLTYMENPNVRTGVFSEQFVVGIDIPEGVYDVTCLEGSGIFEYSVEFPDGYTSYEGKLIGAGDSSFSEIYKNVVLPHGTEVIIEDMTVELTPSEIIESKDYISYYE